MKKHTEVVVYNGTNRVSETEKEILDKKLSKMGNPNWVPGVSGNPNGKPLGARNRFGHDFVQAYAEHWEAHGGKCLDRLAEEDPAAYSRIAIAILPKVLELGEETREVLSEALKHRLPFDLIREKIERDERPAINH